jgi:WD40 repeat protein
VWDVESGTCLRILQEHNAWFKSVCFSADGHMLAGGSEDQTVRVWDVESGTHLQSLQGHTHTALALCFSAANMDGTVCLSDVQTGVCLRTLRSERPYERMKITGATGLTAAQVAVLKVLGAVENS